MPRVPRELSKCRNWEKERRERLSKAFDELAKVLPSYVPSLKICKIEILNQALATIVELKKEVETLSSADKTKSFKDDQVKKLQDRIKKLILRNEQLTSLFREAGITLPKVVGPIKKFRKPGLWSNRFPRNAEATRTNDTEKENVSSNGVRSKPKLAGASPVKCRKIKKNGKNGAGGSKNNVLLLSQIPAVPAINRQLVLVPNAPLNNVQQAPAVLTGSSKKQAKSSKVKPTNSTQTCLTPGTLILQNANVISLVPQPQLVIPQLPSQTIVISKVITKPKSLVTLRKNLPIRPSNCVTKTTQIIKVPIPALTSNYANASVLLKSAQKKSNSAKKATVRASKRKSSSAKHAEAKKPEPETRDESNKTDDQSKETQQKDSTDPQNTATDTPDTNPEIEMNLTGSAEKLISIESSIETAAVPDNETPASNTDNNWLPDKQQDLTAPSVEAPQPTSKTEDVPIKSPDAKATKTVETTAIEDPMKNIDLIHSDLSNDLFASLQVPPGCQNAESTSPTAAFLLAFPLVSSIKVTEVIDEENSDSQRETPTLLQIGGMDSSKPNDGLLNLDNFPFFNSNGYYNSKSNANKNSKLDGEAFSMYSESDRGLELFPKTQMKTAGKSSGKSNENHIDKMLSNIENNEVLFQQNAPNNNKLVASKLTHVVSDKMDSSCNVLSVMNIPQEHEQSTASKFNSSENILYKNVQVSKQLDNSLNKMHMFTFNTEKDTTQKLNSDVSCHTFAANQSSSRAKTSDVANTYFNPLFESLKTCKSSAKIPDKDAECLKDDGSKDVCSKSPCYFSSNFPAASCASNYKADFSKQCTYESQRNYPTPFYTNCNYSYNYPDANAQNYYKPDAKQPCYSLNYENYQEYRKTDAVASFSNNFPNATRKGSAGSKDKSKTVNWMTEQKTQTSDAFLPSFTNQSYSFTDTPDVNNLLDSKKTDFIDKRLSLPSFLEPHNFITPTLPTLVGDLALGNTLTTNDYKCAKETKRKIGYDNQANFLSVSQLVSHNKPDNAAVKAPARRLSAAKPAKPKRYDKSMEKKHGNNFDMFYDQKSRHGHNKNQLSSYSAEALIGTQETKKCDGAAKTSLADNIVPYFTTIDDGYANQNQNFHNSYGHNSFQNNNYPSNNFIYTTPSISTGYLSNNFEANSHDYSDNSINYNKTYNKNYRTNSKEDKNGGYSSVNAKRSKKSNQGNFDYPLLPIQGATNSPALADDYQFLPPPAAPYSCKNPSLYQKQNNDFNLAAVNGGALLPLPGISRGNIQHPQISPSSNTAGTSLTNFNLSTIFPEINKGSFNADIKTADMHRKTDRPPEETGKKYKIILSGIVIHALLLLAVFEVYFSSPLEHGMQPVKSTTNPPAKRLILFVADGLRAQAMFEDPNLDRTPFLTHIKQNKGSWGVSHTRVPTESRPGHVAILAGIYEDPSAILKGWKSNPVDFDSIINQSANAFAWGSPDILNIFDTNNSSSVHLHSYDSSVEDFAKLDTGELDSWVFDRAETFLKQTVSECKKDCEQYYASGNVYFLHLLGIDTAGHGYKPHSSQYEDNIKLVDSRIETITKLFNTVYNESENVFVFTADHGMTDWGSHGTGTDHETQTPLIAWGAGVRRNNTRQDVKQIDLAPLLASLIGINIPVNSLGRLPVGYLAVDPIEMVLSNVEELLRIFEKKSKRIERNALVFVPFGIDILRVMREKKEIVIEEFDEIGRLIIEGIDYYQNYYKYPVLVSVSLGFVMWIVYLCLCTFGLLSYSNSGKSTAIYIFVTALIVIVCFKTDLPLSSYLYFNFPVTAYYSFLSNGDFGKILPKSPVIFLRIIFYLLGIEILVYGFFHRVSFSFIMLILGVVLLKHDEINAMDKFNWLISCGILSIFPCLPVMKTNFNLLVYLMGYLSYAMMFIKLHLRDLRFYESYKHVKLQYSVLYAQFFFLHSAVIYVLLIEFGYIPSDSNIKYLSWIISIVPVLLIPFTDNFVMLRLASIVYGFAPFYALVSSNFELLFSSFYVILLYNWLVIESKCANNSHKMVYYGKFSAAALPLRDRRSTALRPLISRSPIAPSPVDGEAFRRGFMFVALIFVGFFGTGTIASLNSFDPMWTRAFLTVFSPFKMAGLILLKFIVPFVFACGVFRGINEAVKGRILNMFCVILVFSDLMVLQFLYLIDNKGSWLDIGTSLSHFVIVEGFTVVLMLLYGVAACLTGVRYGLRRRVWGD
ncbi:unnamed protein product [Phyllotreta striolata]|uniref:GPI ethanolamine phosphate transferase 1 n=1 Tax=Phyllotreta striolata TaxID=444603 RepID=A0A9N9TRQ8_PHYSR|nr:unnamed protein product [Phyllotreta striolata]